MSALVWEERPVERLDGKGAVNAFHATLHVPENRQKTDSASLPLRVLRLPGNAGGTPLFFSQGGPGGDTVKEAQRRPDFFLRLTSIGDVYFLDQRGSRWTEKHLKADSFSIFADGSLVSRDERIDRLKTLFPEALDQVTARGRDPGGYTASDVARDYIALADALGIKQFNYYGSSFATQVGQILLRDHSPRLNRVLMSGIEPLDATLKLPRNLRAQLARAEGMLCRHALLKPLSTNLYERGEELRQRLNKAPLKVSLPASEQTTERTLFFDGLLADMMMAMQMRRTGVKLLPLLLHGMKIAPREVARRLVRLASLDRVAVDCLQLPFIDSSLGASDSRWEEIERDTPSRCPQRGLCQEDMLALREQLKPWHGDEAARAPAKSDVPIYIYNGTLDANTPMENLPGILQDLPNAHVVQIDGLDHNSGIAAVWWAYEQLESDVEDFLAGGSPRIETMNHPLWPLPRPWKRN